MHDETECNTEPLAASMVNAHPGRRELLGLASCAGAGIVLGSGWLPTAALGQAQDPIEASMKVLRFTGRPLRGLRVALDIGHSTASPGAISARGRGEFYFNLDTARTAADVLRKAGAEPILINEDGSIRGLEERPRIAAEKGAACFVSVHHDSVNDKYIRQWTYEGRSFRYSDAFRGYSVFTSNRSAKAEESRAFALNLGQALLDSGLQPTLHHNEPIQGENRPLINRETGVYEFSDLVVLRTAEIPAVLLECGVIAHRDEELLVQKEAYREVIAHALVRSLVESFGAATGDDTGAEELQRDRKSPFKGLFRKGGA